MVIEDQDGNNHLACNVCGEPEKEVLTKEVEEQLKAIDPKNWDGHMCSGCQQEAFG
ncbi:MAG: hypothetical protein ACXABY_29950 [Candidatus Thorarchaeota archaeon]